MAINWTQVKSNPILMDVTIDKMQADGSFTPPRTGSRTSGNSHGSVTTNSINSLNAATGNLYDVTACTIFSPVDADGSFPDAEFYFVIDGTSTEDVMVIDASADGNMFPFFKQTVGQRTVKFGFSLRDVLARGGMKNMPIYVTGLKANGSVDITVKSTAGWGQNGTVKSPLRIVAHGDTLTANDIDKYTDAFNANTAANLTAIGLPAAYASVDPVGSLSQSWQALPGGVKQTGTKINRSFRHASNQKEITTSNAFTFSDLNTLQGNDGNVSDPQHDLGFDFTQNGNIYVAKEFGLRLPAATQGYLAYRINGTLVPQDTSDGTFVTTGSNQFQFGSVQPLRTASNEYYPLPYADQFVDLLVANAGVAPTFKSASGTIAIGDVEIVQGGVLIQQV